MTATHHNARYAKLRWQVGKRDFNIPNDFLRQITAGRTRTQTDKVIVYCVNIVFQKKRRICFVWQYSTNRLIHTCRHFKQTSFSSCCAIHCNQHTIHGQHFSRRRLQALNCKIVFCLTNKRHSQFSAINPGNSSSFIVLFTRRQRRSSRCCFKHFPQRNMWPVAM